MILLIFCLWTPTDDTVEPTITCYQCQDSNLITQDFEGTECPTGWQETEPTCTTVNTPPVANNDNYDVPEGTPMDLDVTANDYDVDNDELVIISVTQGDKGDVTIVGDVINYYPNPEVQDEDSFTYTISDGNGGTDTATVYITIMV